MTNRVKPFPEIPRTGEFDQLAWPYSRGWSSSYATAGYGNMRCLNLVWDPVWIRVAMQVQRTLQLHD